METGSVMSWKEIEDAFDSEWVLIEDPEHTPSLEIVRGKVIFHSKDRAELNAKMAELPRMHHAVIYIGGLPEGWEMILTSLPATMSP